MVSINIQIAVSKTFLKKFKKLEKLTQQSTNIVLKKGLIKVAKTWFVIFSLVGWRHGAGFPTVGGKGAPPPPPYPTIFFETHPFKTDVLPWGKKKTLKNWKLSLTIVFQT